MEYFIKPGWILNPNPKVVAGITKGIARCEGECPCHNEGESKICPCSDYREHDICHCGLYLLKSSESLISEGNNSTHNKKNEK